MPKRQPAQPSLFVEPEQPLAAAEFPTEYGALAGQLGDLVRLGTMSWSYPGWRGVVYGAEASDKALADRGLTAYCQHPLLTSVEIDRSYYDPLPATVLSGYAAQVPESFRFVVKAHDACVLQRFPQHPRYGKRQGEANPLYLDAAYATDKVIEPTREGLADKLAVLLFQFPPQDVGRPSAFAKRLGQFLTGLPKGLVYAVELRNRELLTPAYGEALAAADAIHCHNVWGEMPSARLQAKSLPPSTRRPLLLRWLMRRGDDYQTAGQRYLPFSRIIDEDLMNRDDIARLVVRATEHGVPAIALFDNKAEGCAPESAVRLARAVVELRQHASTSEQS